MIYVAVVFKAGSSFKSHRTRGDWAAFTAEKKEEAINEAYLAKDAWERSGNYGPYVIFVGTLTQFVKAPVYRLAAIKLKKKSTRKEVK